jgi:hypothetical protein
MHDNVGGGVQVLGDVGINMQQMQDVNLDINPVALNGNAVED